MYSLVQQSRGKGKKNGKWPKSILVNSHKTKTQDFFVPTGRWGERTLKFPILYMATSLAIESNILFGRSRLRL